MSRNLLESKWQDYLFLTDEMKKFLVEQDLDMFFSLLEQREVLQNDILKETDTSYTASTEGKQLLHKVQIANAEMRNSFLVLFNNMKRRENVMQQYEGRTNFAGNYLNKST